jgi:hypothetical protein
VLNIFYYGFRLQVFGARIVCRFPPVIKSISPHMQERLLEAVGILGSISFGPVFLYLGYKAGVMYGAAFYFALFACLAVIPVLSGMAGRFALLAWQLAAISFALTAVIDDGLKGRDGLQVGFWLWAFATIVSSPLPIWLLVEKFKERQQRQKST